MRFARSGKVALVFLLVGQMAFGSLWRRDSDDGSGDGSDGRWRLFGRDGYVSRIIDAHRRYPITATGIQVGATVGATAIAGPLTVGAVLLGPAGIAAGVAGVLLMPAIAKFIDRLKNSKGEYAGGRAPFRPCGDFYGNGSKQVCTSGGQPVYETSRGFSAGDPNNRAAPGLGPTLAADGSYYFLTEKGKTLRYVGGAWVPVADPAQVAVSSGSLPGANFSRHVGAQETTVFSTHSSPMEPGAGNGFVLSGHGRGDNL